MAKKLTPRQIDFKVKKLGKEVSKLKALKEELRKVDRIRSAVSRFEKKSKKKVKRPKKKVKSSYHKKHHRKKHIVKHHHKKKTAERNKLSFFRF